MRRERNFCVYIMASKPRGTLYVGVTGHLQLRIYQHREGLVEGFTKKYSVKRLVYFEVYATVWPAIQREKRIKKWPRAWKINLIRTENPDWNDLAVDWYPKEMLPADIENWIARTSRAMTRVGEGNDP
ncbi:MAG TPA: GIY-YIG nuclease family protein [Rhizomicrobium sp.]|jgi:putative endonuclease